MPLDRDPFSGQHDKKILHEQKIFASRAGSIMQLSDLLKLFREVKQAIDDGEKLNDAIMVQIRISMAATLSRLIEMDPALTIQGIPATDIAAVDLSDAIPGVLIGIKPSEVTGTSVSLAMLDSLRIDLYHNTCATAQERGLDDSYINSVFRDFPTHRLFRDPITDQTAAF